MAIQDLSDDKLNNIEANYRRAGKSVGGKYSLRDVMLERLRRAPSIFSGRESPPKF